LFTTLLQVAGQIGIPAVGLQGVFAQQAAGAMTPEHERELAGVFRGVLRGTFFIWLLMAAAAFLLRDQIQAALKISNPAALWTTVVIGLASLWRPIVSGVLQGRQNFLWLGNIGITEGIARFAAVCVIVGLLANYAAGGMVGVLIGFLVVMLIGGWFCRDCLRGKAAAMDWAGWLRRVVPLTLGLGVGTFMLGADMIFVQRFFSKEQTEFYAAAGMIGRALVYFTTPVATVMFPKLARSKATGEKSHALELALAVTALAGAAAALGCTIFPSLPLRLVYDKSFLDVSTPLVPWFAWCMLPLTLATVLLNSLMARSQFKAVPWLVAVAVGYGLTLYFRHESFTQVIQTLGIFSMLLLGVCCGSRFVVLSLESRVLCPECWRLNSTKGETKSSKNFLSSLGRAMVIFPATNFTMNTTTSYRNLPQLAGLCAMPDAMKPGLSIEECVRRLKRYHYAFKTAAPDSHGAHYRRTDLRTQDGLQPPRVLLRRACGRVRKRVGEMREPPLGWKPCPTRTWRFSSTKSSAHRRRKNLLLGLYERALPMLEQALEQHQTDTNPLADAPSVRLCRFALLEIGDMVNSRAVYCESG